MTKLRPTASPRLYWIGASLSLGMVIGATSCQSTAGLCEPNYCADQEETGIPYICKPLTGFTKVRCFTSEIDAIYWCQNLGGEVRQPICKNYGDADDGTGGPAEEWNPGAHVYFDGSVGVYRVDREFMDEISTNWSALEHEFGHLTPTGSGHYMVDRIALGDLADVMGLRSGDVLLDINGYDLGTLDDQMTAFTELLGQPEFVLTVDRDGVVVRHTYIVVE